MSRLLSRQSSATQDDESDKGSPRTRRNDWSKHGPSRHKTLTDTTEHVLVDQTRVSMICGLPRPYLIHFVAGLVGELVNEPFQHGLPYLRTLRSSTFELAFYRKRSGE